MSDLLARSHNWVTTYYGRHALHLLETERWLRRIDPSASQAMLLAALTHDMERAFPGPDSPRQDPALGPDDPVYNRAHAQRSARIVSDFLRGLQADPELISQVVRLIEAHEFGGWPEANWVQAADSLSFLEVNVEYFLSRIDAPDHGWTRAQVHAKFDWMYERIQIDAARALARPLYDAAIEKLERISSDLYPET